uniref:Uncharacterized protein n=1 Tax=Setaria italica TaxID=4555 RepID=K4AHL3_SETIT
MQCDFSSDLCAWCRRVVVSLPPSREPESRGRSAASKGRPWRRHRPAASGRTVELELRMWAGASNPSTVTGQT